MTKNHPSLRKTASNADLYSDPSPPRPLRHSYSTTLARAHTTANVDLAYRQQRHGRMIERGWKHRETQPDSPSRHSIAAPYPNLIDVDDDYPAPSEHQNPPPVPPKIPEVKKKLSIFSWSSCCRTLQGGPGTLHQALHRLHDE
jgi:aminopeptidase I